MKFHDLRVWRSAEPHAREEELAWQLTELASDPVAVDQDVIEMIGNRIIDNASVAIASLQRRPVAAARQQARRILARGAQRFTGYLGTAASRRNGLPGQTERP